MADDYKVINCEELGNKIADGIEFTLIEVSPRDEYECAHLPQAINIPVDDLRVMVPRLVPSAWDEVVVYGAGPEVAVAAAGELVAIGYKDVKAYEGGKPDWIAAGLPVESSERHGNVA